MNGPEMDLGFIAEALPAFVSEAHEQLEQLEQLLLELEDAPGDRELLDALFRCAHTVKGSAGLFGLDRVVGFTHHVETLLDRLREGELVLDAALGSLLLACKDEIRGLVDQAQDPNADDGRTEAREALVRRLQQACGAAANPASAPAAPAPAAGTRRWHLAVRFGAETFRNGMDPLAILNYLRSLGTLQAMACDEAAVPALDALDPETCHLAFDFWLETAAARDAIEGAFSFVRDDCELSIGEPARSASALAEQIAALPDSPRLGEILVGVGAVSPAQLERGLAQQAAEGGTRPLGEVLQHAAGLAPQVVDAALGKQQRRREAAGGGEDGRYIRVQADRLDAVINLLGELVIASAGASLLARGTRQGALVEANEQITRLVEEIRNGTLQLRMVPIGETFSRFRLVLRDTASELVKVVALEIDGGETELDKSVVERIADPLMHLVRNALDHGLETPAQRTAAGKPAQGRLTLSACHESGNIVIAIVDDGRGIVRQKVLQRAWERGLVEPGTVPEDDAILRLIFEPGFSTAEKVTNLSGRGVGMDVVRRNIEALRGSITIHSTEGQGSRMEIRLPLTLAIIDGFLVGVGASRFIFPLESVVEVIEHRGAPAADSRGRGFVELRGQMLPVVGLRALYALEGPEPERSSVVVLQADGRRFGVRVDQLLGQHQTVIKPLGRMFRSLRGISGSSILGNGEVALIFDVVALARQSQQAPGRALPASAPASATSSAPRNTQTEGQAS